MATSAVRLAEIGIQLARQNYQFDDSVTLCADVSKRWGCELTLAETDKVEEAMDQELERLADHRKRYLDEMLRAGGATINFDQDAAMRNILTDLRVMANEHGVDFHRAVEQSEEEFCSQHGGAPADVVKQARKKAKGRAVYTEAEWKKKYQGYDGDGVVTPVFLLVDWDDAKETPSDAITRLNNEAIDNADAARKAETALKASKKK